MSRVVISVVVLALVVPCLVFAENDNSPNSFGLGFSLEYWGMGGFEYAYTPIELYLTLNNVNISELYGWEVATDVLGNAMITNVEFTGEGVNEGNDRQFRVAYPAPLPCGPVTHLATITLIPIDDSTLNCIGLYGVEDPESTTGMAIEVSEGEFLDVLARVFEGSQIAAQLNGDFPVIGGSWPCEGVVSAETQSWGTIKSLYR